MKGKQRKSVQIEKVGNDARNLFEIFYSLLACLENVFFLDALFYEKSSTSLKQRPHYAIITDISGCAYRAHNPNASHAIQKRGRTRKHKSI